MKFKKTMNQLLRPPTAAKITIWICSAVLLLAALSFWGKDSIQAYLAYAFQAYSVAVFVLALPSFVSTVNVTLSRFPLGRRYLQDKKWQARLSLYAGFAINITFAAMKLLAGIHYRSIWFSAVGVYYLLLGTIRAFLFFGERKTNREKNSLLRRKQKLRNYRASGGLLLFLGLAMSGMTVQMVVQNKSFNYPGFLIYLSAAHAFYCLIASSHSFANSQNLQTPVLSAANTVRLVAAAMSLFALQTAMLTAFGGSPTFKRLMNALLGCTVCLLTVFLAGRMILRGHRELKTLGTETEKSDCLEAFGQVKDSL